MAFLSEATSKSVISAPLGTSSNLHALPSSWTSVASEISHSGSFVSSRGTACLRRSGDNFVQEGGDSLRGNKAAAAVEMLRKSTTQAIRRRLMIKTSLSSFFFMIYLHLLTVPFRRERAESANRPLRI